MKKYGWVERRDKMERELPIIQKWAETFYEDFDQMRVEQIKACFKSISDKCKELIELNNT
jgi:hypothetical protein